jgi:hypothetical protein
MPDDVATTKPSPEADIHDLIDTIDDGALFAQLQDDLREIVTTIRKRSSEGNAKVKAKLTLALSFVFDGKLVQIIPDVTMKIPRPRHGQGVFWVTKDNTLSPQNPAQLELPGTRDVSTAPPRAARANLSVS